MPKNVNTALVANRYHAQARIGSDLQDVCDGIYIRYAAIRSKLRISDDNYPAYELSNFYYEIAKLLFNFHEQTGLSNLDLMKAYCDKCLSSFRPDFKVKIDTFTNSETLLTSLQQQNKAYKSEIKQLKIMHEKWNKKELLPSDGEIQENVLKLAEACMQLGKFRMAREYLGSFAQMLNMPEMRQKLGISREKTASYEPFFNELTQRLNISETLKKQLALEESLMFVEDQEDVKLKIQYSNNDAEMKKTIRDWKDTVVHSKFAHNMLIVSRRGIDNIYLYLTVVDATTSTHSIKEDMVSSSTKNRTMYRLWGLLNKILLGTYDITGNELVQRLLSPEFRTLGLLQDGFQQLSPQRVEKFFSIYEQLANVYEQLGHIPLSNEYSKRLQVWKADPENISVKPAKAKQVLLENQILSEKGLVLPGENYLTKKIKVKDFFTHLVPRLEQIEGLKRNFNFYANEINLNHIPVLRESAETEKIYDLSNIHEVMELKKAIHAARVVSQGEQETAFYALLKVDSEIEHYIALSVVKKEVDGNEYEIYVADSFYIENVFDDRWLDYFQITGDCYQYEFRGYIACPKQRMDSEDGLIHAYINLKAMQWAWGKGQKHWESFLEYFQHQDLSDAANVELIKDFFIKMKFDRIQINESMQALVKKNDAASCYKSSDNFFELLDKIDKNHDFGLEAQTLPLLEKNDLKIYVELAKQMEGPVTLSGILSVEKFENPLFHQLCMVLKLESIDIFSCNSAEEPLCRHILLRLKEAIERSSFKSNYAGVLEEIEARLPFVQTKDFIEIKTLLMDVFSLERQILVTKLVKQAQSLFNHKMAEVLDQISQDTLFDNKSEQKAIKEFNTIISSENIHIDIGSGDLSYYELLEIDERSRKISGTLDDVARNKIFEGFQYKIGYYKTCLEDFKSFSKGLRDGLIERYGDWELQNIYKEVYENRERPLTKLTQMQIYPNDFPASVEAMRLGGVVKEYVHSGGAHSEEDENAMANSLIKIAALKIVREFPGYIAYYRTTFTENFDKFYHCLHTLSLINLKFLNMKCEFYVCEEFPNNIFPEDRRIFLKVIQGASAGEPSSFRYAAAFYSDRKKSIITSEDFSETRIGKTLGTVKLEEKLEKEILDLVGYHQHNDYMVGYQSNTFSKTCQVLIQENSQEVEACQALLLEVERSLDLFVDATERDSHAAAIKYLFAQLPYLRKRANYCGNKIYFNQYFLQCKSLIESFAELVNILPALKEVLWDALVKHYDALPSDDLAKCLKEELLDNIDANLEMNEILGALNFKSLEALRPLMKKLHALQSEFEKRGDMGGKYACAAFLREYVIDIISKYLDSLFTFREEAVVAFNGAEETIYEVLSDYRLLDGDNKGLQAKFREVLELIGKEILDPPKLLLYEKYLNYYRKVLFIVREQQLTFAQRDALRRLTYTFENYQKHTHTFHISTRMINLKKILSNFNAPHDINIEYKRSEGGTRVSVVAKVKSTTLKKLMTHIESELRHYPNHPQLKPGDELQIITMDKVFLDCNLETRYSGVNVILTGPSFVLPPNLRDFIINTDGHHAQSRGGQARNGVDGGQNFDGSGQNGGDGQHGLAGLPGGHAGNIYVVANDFPENAVLSAAGGNGGNGQEGGHGGRGGDGRSGKSGDKTQAKRNMRKVIGDYTTGVIDYFSGVSWDIGTPGMEGGDGGDAGFSGCEGYAGNSGTITVTPFGKQKLPQQKNKAGNTGMPAPLATPGQAGDKGKDGITEVWTANVIRLRQIDGTKDECTDNMETYAVHCYDPETLMQNSGFPAEVNAPIERSNPNYGFIYRSKAHAYGFTEWCHPYIKHDYLESVYRDREKSALGKRGKDSKMNSRCETAEKVSAINGMAVYRECKQFLGGMCQSNNEHYQQWQAGKLAEFLNHFSQHMGQADRYDVPDLEKETKQIAGLRTDALRMITETMQRVQAQESALEKAREQQQLSIGAFNLSLEIAHEIEKIKQNEQLWKATHQFVTLSEQEQTVLVDRKSNAAVKKGKRDDIFQIKPPTLTVQGKRPVLSLVTPIRDRERVDVNRLNSSGQFLFKAIVRLQERIKKKGNNFIAVWMKDSKVYTLKNVLDCLTRIQDDAGFLNQEAEPGENLNCFELLLSYIRYKAPVNFARNFLLTHLMLQERDAEKIIQFIQQNFSCALEPQAEKSYGLHVLVHNVYLIDCLSDLATRLQGMQAIFKSTELFRLLDWLDAFDNLEVASTIIKSFSGDLYDLQKSLLIALLKDTLNYSYTTLKLANDLLFDKMNVELLSVFYNKLQLEYPCATLGQAESNILAYAKIAKDFEHILRSLNDGILTEETVRAFDLKQVLASSELVTWCDTIAKIKLSSQFYHTIERTHIHSDDKKIEACLHFLNFIRKELDLKKYSDLFQAIITRIENLPGQADPLDPVLKLLRSFYDKKITLDQLEMIVQQPYAAWVQTINGIIKNMIYKVPALRGVSEIVEAFKKEFGNQEIGVDIKGIEDDLLSIERLIKVKKQVLDDNAAKKQKIIADWVETDCKEYSELRPAIATLAAAWYATHSEVPRSTQLMAVLLFIKYHERNQSLLSQIKTGEGKTLTVGLISAYFASCRGYFVDVMSSNRDLSIDGQKKCVSFFEILSLSSDHNCHSQEEDRKKSYTKQIVYGEVSVYQGDILDSQFNQKGVVGDRYGKDFKDRSKVCLIVDEVDSMCLDKARDVLYLSHSIEGLKWLETVFLYIWIAVLKEAVLEESDFQSCVEKVAEGIKNCIESGNIFVSDNMKPYVFSKLKIWTESAFQARSMDANNEFVIDKSDAQYGQGTQKRIIVLDKDVGVEQYSSRWSDGLAQFVELKFRRKISVESLKAVFMSNKHFFGLYGQKLYGLTGTLGNDISKRFLQEVYSANFAIIPTAYQKQYHMKRPQFGTTVMEWASLIIQSVKKYSDRPVLIITDTVENAKFIMKQLNAGSSARIRSYIRDCDEVESYFQRNPATSGDVVVATNKGGRGTDIRVSDVINREFGGMHVILSYLPKNDRIEEQAFGRTSRNGNPGSGQFILLLDDDPDLKAKLADLDPKEQLKKLADWAPGILQKMKDRRDKEAEGSYSVVMREGIPRLELEQKLFEAFEKHSRKISRNRKKEIEEYIESLKDELNTSAAMEFTFTRYGNKEKHGLLEESFVRAGGYERFQTLENIKTDLIDGVFKRQLQAFVLEVMRDHWAFWLDSVQPEIKRVDRTNSQKVLEDLLRRLRNEFQPFMQDDILKLAKYPEQQLKLGELFLYHGSREHAKKCFEKAAERDLTGTAYIGLAYCEIPPDGGKSSDDFDLKKKVRRHLKDAKFKIEAMQRTLHVSYSMGSELAKLTQNDFRVSQYVSQGDNFYCVQLEGKLKVLQMHLKIITKAIGSSLESEYVFSQGNEKEYGKSKEIYFQFVNKKIIHHNRVRRKYKEGDVLEITIINNFDKSISGPLIRLLRDNINENHIREERFQSIVRDREEFWEILSKCGLESHEVIVLDTDRAMKNLPYAYQDTVKELLGNVDHDSVLSSGNRVRCLDPYNVSFDIFDASSQKKELKLLWEKEGFFSNQERVLIGDHFLFIERLRQKIRSTKYEAIVLKSDRGTRDEGICDYFAAALKQKNEAEDPSVRDYLYSSDIPFNTKEQEARGVIKLLHDLKVLKSGGLALKNQYDSGGLKKANKYDSEGLKKALEKDFKASMPTRVEPYFDHVAGLQGDIRSYKDGLKGWLKQFMDIDSKDIGAQGSIEIPEELPFYRPIGFHRVLVLEEYERFHMNWSALFVFILGVIQVTVGSLLCAIGMPNFGNALISEGVSDMVQGMIGMITGQFNLLDWATSKAISFAVSMLTAGIQTFSKIGEGAGKVVYGTLSKSQIFIKSLGRACLDVVMEVGISLISQYGIGALMSEIEAAIINQIRPSVQNELNISFSKIKEQLKEIRNTHGHVKYQEVLHDFKTKMFSVLKDKALQKEVESLQTVIHSAMKIINATKKPGSESGDWKQKLTQRAMSMVIDLAKKQAINVLVTSTEIRNLLGRIDKVARDTLAGLKDRVEKKVEFEQNSGGENCDLEVDKELTSMIEAVSGRITGDIMSLITGATSGVFKSTVSVSSSVLFDVLDDKLTQQFEKRNQRVAEKQSRQTVEHKPSQEREVLRDASDIKKLPGNRAANNKQPDQDGTLAEHRLVMEGVVKSKDASGRIDSDKKQDSEALKINRLNRGQQDKTKRRNSLGAVNTSKRDAEGVSIKSGATKDPASKRSHAPMPGAKMTVNSNDVQQSRTQATTNIDPSKIDILGPLTYGGIVGGNQVAKALNLAQGTGQKEHQNVGAFERIERALNKEVPVLPQVKDALLDPLRQAQRQHCNAAESNHKFGKRIACNGLSLTEKVLDAVIPTTYCDMALSIAAPGAAGAVIKRAKVFLPPAAKVVSGVTAKVLNTGTKMLLSSRIKKIAKHGLNQTATSTSRSLNNDLTPISRSQNYEPKVIDLGTTSFKTFSKKH